MSSWLAGVPLADKTSMMCSRHRSLSFVRLLSLMPWRVVVWRLAARAPLVGGRVNKVTVVVEGFFPFVYLDLALDVTES